MRLPLSWLNEYLATPLNLQQAEDAIARTTMEIEEVKPNGNFDSKIVVGLVKSVAKHADADKLAICIVSDGKKDFQVVTGANNVMVGQKVPFAKTGALLPTGQKITAGKFRGEKSDGMLCSADELGLGDDHTGIHILDDEAEVGRELAVELGGEVVLDLKTPPNRPDLNSVIGIAREMAVQAKIKFKVELPAERSAKLDDARLNVVAEALVSGYLAAWLELPNDLPATPDWMRTRLEAAGVRTINLVVDVTNYVMLEWGQPLHAFDAAKIEGIVQIRLAEAGESLVTLDGSKRDLAQTDLVIADDTGAIALSGVMGGQTSEFDENTQRLMLEAAIFDGPTVRKTALRLGLRTEASARFERNLVGEGANLALNRAIQLLTELAHARLKASAGAIKTTALDPVPVSLSQASSYLGVKLNPTEAVSYLEELGFKAASAGLNELQVKPPWWRPDIKITEDLIEELAKLVGYESIPATLPPLTLSEIEVDRWWHGIFELKAVLRGAGLFELNTYAFLGANDLEKVDQEAKEYLELANPRSNEQRYLRRDLLPSLLKTVSANLAYAKNFGCFEISSVFLPEAGNELPDEPLHLAVIWRTEDNGYRAVKAVVDLLAAQFNWRLNFTPDEDPRYFPGRLAAVNLGEKLVGQIGELHPGLLRRWKIDQTLGYLEVDLTLFLQQTGTVQARSVAKFPPITRDLTVAVPRSVKWQEIEAGLKELDLAEVTFVNDYYGPELGDEQKAVAMRLVMRSDEATLTDTEGEARLAEITDYLKKTFHATAR